MAKKLAHYLISTMSTVAILSDVQETRPDGSEQGTADLLPYFAEEAAEERGHPGRGILWGLFLGGGLWMGIFALVALLKH